MGIYFVAYNVIQGYPYLTAALSGMSFILLLTVPILTMRSFAEERNDGSALLLTSPVSVTQIVLRQICRDGVRSRNLYADILHSACRDSFYGGGSLIAGYSAIVGFFLLGGVYRHRHVCRR